MTHLVDIRIDNKAMYAWAKVVGLNNVDIGYIVHSLLCAAHGEFRLRPFRVYPGNASTRVLGYSAVDAGKLIATRKSVAEPMVSDAISSEVSKEMPDNWNIGDTFNFSVLLTPLYQISRTRKQADVFLKAPDGADRGEVYVKWLGDKIAKAGVISDASMKMFKFEKVQRRGSDRTSGKRKIGHKFTIPTAEIVGKITVEDGDEFSKMISNAVGRHAAFGLGAVFLRP